MADNNKPGAVSSGGRSISETNSDVTTLLAELEKYKARCADYEKELNELKVRFNSLKPYRREFGDLSPLGFLYCHADLSVADANPTMIQIFGKNDIGEVSGRSLLTLSPDFARMGGPAICRRVMETGEPVVINDMGLSEKTPSRRYRVTIFRIDDGIGFISFDITEEVRAKQELVDWQHLIDYIIKHDPNAIAVYDKDLHYIFASERYLKDYNVKLDNIIGKHHYEVFPEMPERWKEVHRRVLNGAVERSEDDSFERADGRTDFNRWECRPWYDSQGNIGGMITYTEVTTERRQAEESFRKSEEKYRLIFETAANLITSVDSNGTLLECNGRIVDVLGYAREEIIGRNMGMIIHPYYHERAQESLAELIETGKAHNKIYKMVRKDGISIDVRVNSSAITDDRGRFVRSICIIDDITESMRIERKLREQEKVLSDILEDTLSGYWDWNIQKNEEYLSPAFKKMFGYEDHELPNSPESWQKLICEDDLPAVLECFDRHVKSHGKEPYYNEIRYRHKNGSIIWVICAGRVIEWADDGTPIRMVGCHVDITQQKLAEEQLRESKDFAENLIRTANALVVVLDENGQIRIFNKSAEEITGYTFEELRGKNWFEILVPRERYPEVWEIFERLKEGELAKNFENPILTKAGEERFIVWQNNELMENGEIRGSVSFGIDVTEKRLAEAKIKENEEKFMALFEQSPYPVVLVDGKSGNIIEFNEKAHETLGYTRDEFKKLRISEIDILESEQDTMRHIGAVIEKGGETFETRHRTRDGRILDISVSTRVIDWDGRRCFVSIWIDITETKRLRELESRAQRLETAGKISGQIAHDFNNLLAPLITYPDFIREELPEDHAIHEYIDAMEDAARNIADINQQLLTLGRRGHYNQEIFDLNDIVKQVVNHLCQNRQTVKYNLELCNELLKMKGGRAQIHRMLSNLIMNAQDAIQNIGMISIGTEDYYVDEDSVQFERIPRGEYVRLKVSDNGCGIPEEVLQKIFDPFFTLKETDRKRGSGLGLSVVDAVVKDHGGFINVDSRIGKGTTFSIYFPATREEIGVPMAGSGQIVGGNEKVLIVDDDPTQCDVTMRVMKKLGYTVSVVESGEKAVEFIGDNPQDIVILDMIMPPGIDGTETFRRIREKYPDQKAILLSGFSETNRVQEAQRLGAGTFVKKPVSFAGLAREVREELDRK